MRRELSVVGFQANKYFPYMLACRSCVLAVPSRSALRDEVPTSPRAFKEAQHGAMVHPYRVEAGGKESERHKRTGHGGWTGEAGTGLTLTLRRRAVSLAAWTS